MPTTIDSAGITFNDATSLTSAVLAANSVGATQIANGSVTAAKLGTTEQRQIAKAWVNFNGTTATPSTIRSSYNVSSVTKNGTGDYTLNFTTALADANYSVSGTTNQVMLANNSLGFTIRDTGTGSLTTTSLRINTGSKSTGNVGDCSLICITVNGN
jgi:hypothetical protein